MDKSPFGQHHYCYYPTINQCATNTVRQQSQRVTTNHAKGIAQERRSLENEEFKRLSSLLPIPSEISEKHLDKASIVRLSKTTIRLNSAICQWKSNHYIGGPLIENNVINLIDGFLCVFSSGYEFLYISESVSQYLGLSQVELCGTSLWNYIHSDDLPYVRKSLNDLQDGIITDLFLNFRMRSTLTKRRSRESPSCTSGFKVITMEITNNTSNWPLILAFCQPHTARLSSALRISNAWVISTDDSLTITYTDIPSRLIGRHLIGYSFYKLIHPDDIDEIVEMHENLQVVGSARTKFVRLLINSGQIDAEIMAIRYVHNEGAKFKKMSQGNRITLLIIN